MTKEAIEKVLREPLDKDIKQKFGQQLLDVEALSVEVSTQYRQAQVKLQEAKNMNMLPSGTVMERQAHLDFKCKDEQYEVDRWADMQQIIVRRLELGRVMLTCFDTEGL